MRPSLPLLTKTPAEVRTYEHDLSAHPEFATNGETISSVLTKTIEAVEGTPTPPTLGSNTISGARVQYSISAGDVGKYLIKIVVVTSAGAHLEDGVELSIQEFVGVIP